MLQFWLNTRGSAVEKYAIGALVATLGAFFVGQTVVQYADNGDLSSLAFLEPGFGGSAKGKAPKFNSIDMATTGSIKGQVVVLNPCSVEQKN